MINQIRMTNDDVSFHPRTTDLAPRTNRANFTGLVLGCTSYGARPQARAVNLSLTINLAWKIFGNFSKISKKIFKKFSKKNFQKFFGNYGEAGDFFADRFEKFSTPRGAKAGVAGRSRRELPVAYLLAKYGLHPAENEPRQDCKFSANFRKFRRRCRLRRRPFRKIFDAGRCKSWGCG